MPSQKVLGKRMARVDAWDKVTGRAAFGDDTHLPFTLYGRVLRSPYAHARIKRLDLSKALALEGVKAAVTGRDLPEPGPMTAVLTPEAGISVSAARGSIMAREKVAYEASPWRR